ncbi:MAG: Uma2 family endonuclease [Chloroflexi bacterium]|nr:Uma2 family endonuclease [Chloroflexota bacterium]
MTLETKRLTYEDYLKGPEIKQRYDIIDGEMIMAPSPNLQHQRILRKLFLQVHRFVSEHQSGEVFFAPLDVVVRREPLRIRQPDLMFVSNDRANILGQIVEGAPDLVVEVLSPGNSRGEMESKLADYAQLGVREYWLVSPEAMTVEVLELDEGAWQRASLSGAGDHVSSEVLQGLELEVSQLFV